MGRRCQWQFFPILLRPRSAQSILQGDAIQLFAGNLEHRPNVPQMFLRTAFAKILQLADDDVFRRSQHKHFVLKLNLAPVSETPCVQFIPSGRIDICFEAGVLVDDIEMTVLFARNFSQNGFQGRQIEICWRKNVR
ncbi:MAG: hypothetical protein WDM80_08030 [Limisphaerales bacterium]